MRRAARPALAAEALPGQALNRLLRFVLAALAAASAILLAG